MKNRILRTLRSLLVIASSLFGIWLNIQTAHAQIAIGTAGNPFYCDQRFYQVRTNGATATYVVTYPDLAAGTVPFNPYGGGQFLTQPLNALGFNPRDNYLYALSYNLGAGSTDNTLYRIGQSGLEVVGVITGLPAGVLRSTGGVFDKQGNFYFAYQGPAGIDPVAIYRVSNIPTSGTATLVAKTYNLSPNVVNFGDFAFTNASDGINGTLYGTTGTTHHRIVLNDAASTATATTVTVAPTVGGIGSAFYDRPTDRFYVFNNGASTFSEVANVAGPGNATSSNTVVTAPSFIPAGFVNSATDGASCILANNQAADLRITKSVQPTTTVTVGQNVTFTVVINNAGPSPSQNVAVREQLPAGLNLVSVSATTGTYATPTWTIANLPAFTSQTLTIVATVNSAGTSTASFVNIASVAGSSQVGTTTVIPLTDPTPGNNTGTATVTSRVSVNLQITKTDGITTTTAGVTNNYTVTVTNLGPNDLANGVLRDPVAPGLSCVLGTAPVCTASGTAGSVCPTVGAGAGQLNIGSLQGTGVIIPLLKSGGTMSFRVSCGVRATGLP